MVFCIRLEINEQSAIACLPTAVNIDIRSAVFLVHSRNSLGQDIFCLTAFAKEYPSSS